MKLSTIKLPAVPLRRDPLDTCAVTYFSPDYFTAKSRFGAMCQRLKLDCYSLTVDAPSPTPEPLTIDVAVAGASQPRSALVVSSGVHGVEGFFGSAVQLAFLEQVMPNWRPPDECALIFLHAINPFGFAWRRRFNEVNVDLNRNFLPADEEYLGAPPLCGVFRRALTPIHSRARFTAGLKLAKLALRHGVRSFWETLPVGQYEFDDWLFFGGRGRTQSAKLLAELLPSLLHTAKDIVHLDFHTGLGRWANCQILLSQSDSAEHVSWWRQNFGAHNVSAADDAARTYEIRGGFGSWLQGQFSRARYRFATAEFGTYSPMRIMQSLLDERHWHMKLGAASPDHWSRHRLAEVFVPRDPRWRAQTLAMGVALIRSGANALWHSEDPLRRTLAAT